MLVAGVDVGSRATKAVIIDTLCRIQGQATIRTRPDFPGVAREALETAARAGGVDPAAIVYLATTGFGRYNVPFRDLQITEITCAARGAAFLFPSTRTVLDVGAQSTRAIRIHAGGKVREFKSNDKCAAGSGGFLERVARYLEVPLEEIGDFSLRADAPQPVSSVCAVLAESEIINHVSAGQSVENIVRGIHDGLAARAQTLLSRVQLEPQLTVVGGVARQGGMVRALEDVTGLKVNVPEDPDVVGALGAAVLGLQRAQKRMPAKAS
jgi:predicted CoA-substrate-specific enzyme activase